jgi:hypothetical protein
MLNERQEHSLKIMVENCYGKSQIKNKIVLNYLFNVDDENGTAYLVPSEFNSSFEARQMSDDFLAITMDQDNPYIVVSSKSGIYITDCIEEKNAYILRLRDEANAKHKLASDIARLPLNGQIRVMAI